MGSGTQASSSWRIGYKNAKGINANTLAAILLVHLAIDTLENTTHIVQVAGHESFITQGRMRCFAAEQEQYLDTSNANPVFPMLSGKRVGETSLCQPLQKLGHIDVYGGIRNQHTQHRHKYFIETSICISQMLASNVLLGCFHIMS